RCPPIVRASIADPWNETAVQVCCGPILRLIGARNGSVYRNNVCWWQIVVEGNLNRNTLLRNDDPAKVLLCLTAPAERASRIEPPQGVLHGFGGRVILDLTYIDGVVLRAGLGGGNRTRRRHRNPARSYSS